MVLPEAGIRLCIYIGETDQHEGRPLFDWLIRKAREMRMAGATVIRGIAGFGAHSRIHTTRLLRLSEDLPVVVEIIDAKERIHAYVNLIEPIIQEGLITEEPVTVRLYRSRQIDSV